jgi:hypothetical protein
VVALGEKKVYVCVSVCVCVCTYGPINSGGKNFGLIMTLHLLAEFCGINFCKDRLVVLEFFHAHRPTDREH